MARLDARTKTTGRQGVAAARAALQAGRRQAADTAPTAPRATRGPRQPDASRTAPGTPSAQAQE